jgi:outer membrane receptor for ferrienterochelin and colicin
MRKVNSILPAFIFIVFLISNLIIAQSTGKIVGTVVDADSKEPLIGANIIIEGTSLGAATDIDGTFIMLRVPPGKYEIRIIYLGYQEVIMQNVEVLTDLTTTLNFNLKPQVLEGESVVIVAESPVVRPDLTSVEARVQAEQIQNMAVTELGDVLSLQAGVSRDADGAIHIRGGRSTEVSYRVNGISITDDFTRTQAFIVENESVQELQVISGTFNAEYGDAMSGIINIVTKTGGSQITGDLEIWAGDYLSNRDDVFWSITKFDVTENYNFTGSLGGPIIGNKLTFFATGRRFYTDGWLYGPNAYLPEGNRKFVTGDSGAVSMNFKDRWSGQATLSWQIVSPLKFQIDALGSMEKRRNYDHFFKLNPTGDRGDDEKGYSIIGKLTHQLGKVTFHEATVAYKYNRLDSKLFDDLFSSGYVHPDSLNTGVNEFAKGGTDMDWFERYTKSLIAKWDITSQLHRRHQFKGGLEFQFDELFYNDITLVPKKDENGQDIQPFETDTLPQSSNRHNEFTREPFKFAAYIQDKIEYESLIINAGLRFDLFDPKGQIPIDPEDPNVYNPFKLINLYKDTNGNGVIDPGERTEDNKYTLQEREQFWYQDTKVKTLLSPRLGVAFPITETGVIHFSYGIFQQVPDYQLLYVDDQLKITSTGGRQGPFGNPDLEPKQTTMYELGLQQELTSDLAIDITGFYRDIRDWISTSEPIITQLAGVSYVVNTNKDFANVGGVTLTLRRKFANHFAFNVDYTFQFADGTNSDPDQEFFAQRDQGAEPTKILTPLDWDQRHALNTNIYVGSKSWGVNLLTRFDSGQPYTPSLVTGSRTGQSILAGLPKNSRNKPNLFTVDLKAYKDFKLNFMKIQVYARVLNLFDAKNPIIVYGDTGLADFTFDTRNPHDETWFVDPSFYSQPRNFQFGIRFSYR